MSRCRPGRLSKIFDPVGARSPLTPKGAEKLGPTKAEAQRAEGFICAGVYQVVVIRLTHNETLKLTLEIGDIYPECGLDLPTLLEQVCHAIMTRIDAEWVRIENGSEILAEVFIETHESVQLVPDED